MITLTETAQQHFENSLKKRGKGIGILIGTKTSGCSGLAYVLEFVDKEPSAEEYGKYTFGSVDVWVNQRDRVYLEGMIVDYVKHGLGEGIEFRNPNESSRCGCGESFRI